MKKALLACMLLTMLTSCATGQGSMHYTQPEAARQPEAIKAGDRGHVAFFFTAGIEYAEHRKAYADYLFYYEKSKVPLTAEGYTYSYSSRFPIVIDNGGLTVSLGAGNLSQSAGYVLIKQGGRFRVVYGVYSELDLIKIAREYFNQP